MGTSMDEARQQVLEEREARDDVNQPRSTIMASKGKFISGDESFMIVPHHDLYIWAGPFPADELHGHMQGYTGLKARSITIAEAYAQATRSPGSAT